MAGERSASTGNVGVIVDQSGNLIRPQAGLPFINQPQRHHEGAQFGGELSSWHPALTSPDGALLHEQDTLRARSEDAIRNSGPLWGAREGLVAKIIGGSFHLNYKPDADVLGISATAAVDFARQVEREWRLYAYDPENRINQSQHFDFPGLLAQGFMSRMTSFETLSVAAWRPNRGGRYATCIANINPARLSNPDGKHDTDRLRQGVSFTARDGSPQAYHIVNFLQNDHYQGMTTRRWRRVPKYTSTGRRIVFHDFNPDGAGQSRGRGGIMSVLLNSRMTQQLKRSTLQATILNAAYAMVIQSSFDWAAVREALDDRGVGEQTDAATQYLTGSAKFHKPNDGVSFNGAKISHLYPGEDLKFINPNHPSANFANFAEFFDREMAAGLNMSYEEYTRDYSKSNYAGLRASEMQSWKSCLLDRQRIVGRHATWMFMLWLEEATDKGTVQLPPGAPRFADAREAYAIACQWRGPAKGHIDPLREVKALALEIQLGVKSVEQAAAENGSDAREVLAARAQAISEAHELAESMGIEGVTWETLVPALATAGESMAEQNPPEEARSA